MISFISNSGLYTQPFCKLLTDNQNDQILAFERKEYLFVFNFNPFRSFTDYGIPTGHGKFRIVLNTDNPAYGGNGNVDEKLTYMARGQAQYGSPSYLLLYLPSRSALVLQRKKTPRVY
jgi:1,4-alpha-glucan branching enzyme